MFPCITVWHYLWYVLLRACARLIHTGMLLVRASADSTLPVVTLSWGVTGPIGLKAQTPQMLPCITVSIIYGIFIPGAGLIHGAAHRGIVQDLNLPVSTKRHCRALLGPLWTEESTNTTEFAVYYCSIIVVYGSRYAQIDPHRHAARQGHLAGPQPCLNTLAKLQGVTWALDTESTNTRMLPCTVAFMANCSRACARLIHTGMLLVKGHLAGPQPCLRAHLASTAGRYLGPVWTQKHKRHRFCRVLL
jgi:hypothetical protein